MAFSASFLYKIKDKMSPVMRKFLKDNQALQKQLKANQAQANLVGTRFKEMGKTGSIAMAQITTAGAKTATMFEVVKRKAREAKKDISATLKIAGGKMKSAAASTRTASLIATATIMGSVAAHAKFEKGLTDTFNLNATERYSEIGQSIESLTEKAIGMNFGIQGSNKAMFDTISGMGDSKRALDTYNEGLILARAGNSDLMPALSAMTSAMEVYEIKTGGAAKVARDLFLAQRIGRTDIETLSGAIGRFLPIAKAMGLNFSEASSAAAIFTKGGLSTEEAVVSLRGVFAQLSVVQGRAAKTLKALNIPFKVSEVRAAGLTETFRRLLKAQKEHPDAIKMALPNIRAMIGALGLTDEKLKLMNDTLEESKNQTAKNSVVLKAYANVQKTVAANAADMKGELTLALIEMGEKLRPITLAVVKAITWLAKKFTEAGKSTKFLTIAVIGFGAALSPLLGGAGLILLATSSMVKYIGIMKKSTLATNIMSFSLKGLFWPITLIAGAIVGLVAWFSKSKMGSEVFAYSMDRLKGAGDRLFGAFNKFLGLFGADVKNAGELWDEYLAPGLEWLVTGVVVGAIEGIVAVVDLVTLQFKGWADVLDMVATSLDAITRGGFKFNIDAENAEKDLAKMKAYLEKLRAGQETKRRLDTEKNTTVDKFAPQQMPEQRIGGDLNINVNDPGKNVESVKSNLFGLDNMGVTMAGV